MDPSRSLFCAQSAPRCAANGWPAAVFAKARWGSVSLMCRGLLLLDWDAWLFLLVLRYLDTRLVGLVLTPTWWTRRRVLFELRIVLANGRIKTFCWSRAELRRGCGFCERMRDLVWLLFMRMIVVLRYSGKGCSSRLEHIVGYR